MKPFICDCGHSLYFENSECVNCGAAVVFDPAAMQMTVLSEPRTRCDNGTRYGVCNWQQPSDDSHIFCLACQLNRTIPNLSRAQNLGRWTKFEAAKRRLVYNLLSLGLPIASGHVDSDKGLLFDFIEDERSDPERYPESFVHTGYSAGIVTINVLEADDVAREVARAELNEPYRTLLGHMRHESGHYYLEQILLEPGLKQRFESSFGELSADYAAALETYYQSGPAANWRRRYISAYASAHPLEDWAETWAHYLQIRDSLETAQAHGLIAADSESATSDMVAKWRVLSVTLNELNRSNGLGDAYPFVVSDVVETKLDTVAALIDALRTRRSDPADC